MKEELKFYPKHPSDEKTAMIETTSMPYLNEGLVVEVGSLNDEFKTDFDKALNKYVDKRFMVEGYAIKVGADIHNKPSIEIAHEIDGKCCSLCIFPNDDHYTKVKVGDKVKVEANYLVYANWYGVVMKYAKLVEVNND